MTRFIGLQQQLPILDSERGGTRFLQSETAVFQGGLFWAFCSDSCASDTASQRNGKSGVYDLSWVSGFSRFRYPNVDFTPSLLGRTLTTRRSPGSHLAGRLFCGKFFEICCHIVCGLTDSGERTCTCSTKIRIKGNEFQTRIFRILKYYLSNTATQLNKHRNGFCSSFSYSLSCSCSHQCKRCSYHLPQEGDLPNWSTDCQRCLLWSVLILLLSYLLLLLTDNMQLFSQSLISFKISSLMALSAVKRLTLLFAFHSTTPLGSPSTAERVEELMARSCNSGTSRLNSVGSHLQKFAIQSRLIQFNRRQWWYWRYYRWSIPHFPTN